MHKIHCQVEGEKIMRHGVTQNKTWRDTHRALSKATRHREGVIKSSRQTFFSCRLFFPAALSPQLRQEQVFTSPPLERVLPLFSRLFDLISGNMFLFLPPRGPLVAP
ncbi:hypothetical protein CEXT_533201 [Caerostris extrusa]|uniref:Uncharacterized protein n=1 Tax=Caerostris extrusa TaxID=172846 RepID=A0AAV4MSP1_CAEEX|nr:hypothetical protein CEXT_533201 [Caerostris extrusa]